MQNNFWKTLSIILIVVLVVGAVIVFWKNPVLSPKTPNYPYYTKAEVDAKMEDLITSSVNTNYFYATSGGVKDYIGETMSVRDRISTKDISITGSTILNGLNSNSFTNLNGQLYAKEISTFYKGVVLINLSGTGNAYVCVDYNGRLFRSTTPCK